MSSKALGMISKLESKLRAHKESRRLHRIANRRAADLIQRMSAGGYWTPTEAKETLQDLKRAYEAPAP